MMVRLILCVLEVPCRLPPSAHFTHLTLVEKGGYCFVNNAAVAAQILCQQDKRVAIVDVDYHHGNGTQDIFYSRCDVLYVSLHGDPSRAYPYFSGSQAETGQGEGTGFNVNLPLPAGCNDELYAITSFLH